MTVDGVDPSVCHTQTSPLQLSFCKGRSVWIAEQVLEQPSSYGAILPLKS